MHIIISVQRAQIYFHVTMEIDLKLFHSDSGVWSYRVSWSRLVQSLVCLVRQLTVLVSQHILVRLVSTIIHALEYLFKLWALLQRREEEQG